MVKLLISIWLSKGWFAIQLKHHQRQRHEFVTLDTTRRLEPKCVPQWFLGPLLRTRLSAIGHFSLSQKSLRRLTRPSFLFFYSGKYLTITLGKVNLFYTNCQRFSWWWSYALLACFFPNNRLLSYAIMSSLLHIPLLILCSFLIEIMLAVPRDSILLTTFVYNQSPLKRSLSFAIRDFNSVALFWWILLEMEAFFSRWTYFTRMTW